MKLTDRWLSLYESKRLYLVNPCDVGAHWFFAPFGQALSYFGSSCPCCAGTRVLLAAALTAMLPKLMLTALLALFVVAFVYSVFNPQTQIVPPEVEPPKNEEPAKNEEPPKNEEPAP